MATGALDTNGVWIYGEDDSNTTFSALLNRLGSSIGSTLKGRVVQIIFGTTSTNFTSSTTTYISTGLSASITPKNANNKLIVIVQQAGVMKEAANAGNAANLRLMRDSTPLINFGNAIGYTATALNNLVGTQGVIYVETASSTTARSYSTEFANRQNSAYVGVQDTSATSTMVILEVTA